MSKNVDSIAKAMVAPGKGILAADESFPTIAKRFASIGVESSETLRRDYREMLFTTPGAEAYISGVILFDETLFQKGADGTPFVATLERLGILPGIKVDAGAKDLGSDADVPSRCNIEVKGDGPIVVRVPAWNRNAIKEVPH